MKFKTVFLSIMVVIGMSLLFNPPELVSASASVKSDISSEGQITPDATHKKYITIESKINGYHFPIITMMASTKVGYI